jgi:hypothetical protein
MSIPLVFKRITVTIAKANVAQAISSAKIISNQIEMYVSSGSTGPVYIGDENVTSSWIPKAAGSTTTFTSSSGGSLMDGPYFDLSQVYLLSATAGDVVIVQYLARGAL